MEDDEDDEMDDIDSDEMIDVKPIISFDEGSATSSHQHSGSGMEMLPMSQSMSMSQDSQMMLSGGGGGLASGGTSPADPNASGGKICVCHLCHLTFTAYSSLRRHMARHYADRERYECDICFKSYSRKDYLKEHKKLKHPAS